MEEERGEPGLVSGNKVTTLFVSTQDFLLTLTRAPTRTNKTTNGLVVIVVTLLRCILHILLSIVQGHAQKPCVQERIV